MNLRNNWNIQNADIIIYTESGSQTIEKNWYFEKMQKVLLECTLKKTS